MPCYQHIPVPSISPRGPACPVGYAGDPQRRGGPPKRPCICDAGPTMRSTHSARLYVCCCVSVVADDCNTLSRVTHSAYISLYTCMRLPLSQRITNDHDQPCTSPSLPLSPQHPLRFLLHRHARHGGGDDGPRAHGPRGAEDALPPPARAHAQPGDVQVDAGEPGDEGTDPADARAADGPGGPGRGERESGGWSEW